MSKFNLVWENNPETPLSARNLSKFVSYSSDEGKQILYVDDPSVYPNGDSKLKLRANSKISFPVPTTNAFFRFDDSLVSHDSKYIATQARAVSSRIETLYSNSKSIGIDEASNNIINDANWNFTQAGSSTYTENMGDYPSEDAKFIEFYTDSTGSRVEASQMVDLIETNIDRVFSLSFYYKGTGLRLQIEGDTSQPVKRYWREEILIVQWQGAEFTYVLPSVSEWTRFSVANIPTVDLIDTLVNIKIFSINPNVECSFGAVQIEFLDYSSSYSVLGISRQSSQLLYQSDLIDPKEGTIDMTIKVDSFKNNNIILLTKTSSQDAMKLFFDTTNQLLIFRVFDTTTSSNITSSIPVLLNNIRFQFVRIIACWKESLGLRLTFKRGTDNAVIQTNNTQFTSFSTQDITSLHLGGDFVGASSVSVLRGQIDSLKINFLYKSVDEIANDLLITPYSDENDYRFFEVGSENIVLDDNFLDVGVFEPSTKYFVWVCDNRDSVGASVIISKSDFEPSDRKRFYSRIIGSFSTTSSSYVDSFSVWDISTYSTDVVHTNRFVLGGINTPTPDIEFKKMPFGDSNRATFNTPTYFTDNIYGGSFMSIDSLGVFNFDNVRIDGSTISAIQSNTNLNLSTSGTGNVVINSNNIQMTTTTGSLQFDNLRIKENRIYSESGYDLVIRNDESTSDIFVQAPTGNTSINSQSISLTANSGNINLDEVRIKTGTISNPNSNLVITSIDNVEIISGSGEIHLDNLKVKTDTIFNDIGDINIESQNNSVNITGNNINLNSIAGTLGIENIKIDGNKILSESGYNLVLETENPGNHIYINSPGAGSVFINSVKFDTNQIYTNSGTHLNIHSVSGSDVRFSGERILFQTSLTMQNQEIRFIDSASQYTNIIGSSSGRGVITYPASSVASSVAVFTVSNNSLNKQFEVLNGDGIRIGQSGTIQYNQDNPVGTEVLGYNGHFYATKVFNAVYNDLAECWYKEKDAVIDFGEVVVRNSGLGVMKSTKRAQKNVIGVVSKDFGYLLGAEGYNEDLQKSEKVAIAISGRVKVKLAPNTHKRLTFGDELVSFRDGCATKASFFERVFKRSSIIGKVDMILSPLEAIIKV